MSDAIQHIDIDSDDFIDAPKALRDYAKKLKRANEQLTERTQTLTGQLTVTALTDVLKEFKNPERVKRDLLSDKVDPLDSEAVTTWLASNADDYAKGSATSTQSQSSAADEAEIAAHQRINSGSELRQPADMSKLEAAQAEITPDMDGQAVIAVYRKHGL